MRRHFDVRTAAKTFWRQEANLWQEVARTIFDPPLRWEEVPRLGTKPKGAVRRLAGFGRAPHESEQVFGNADDDTAQPWCRSAADVYNTVQTFEEGREVRRCAAEDATAPSIGSR